MRSYSVSDSEPNDHMKYAFKDENVVIFLDKFNKQKKICNILRKDGLKIPPEKVKVAVPLLGYWLSVRFSSYFD